MPKKLERKMDEIKRMMQGFSSYATDYQGGHIGTHIEQDHTALKESVKLENKDVSSSFFNRKEADSLIRDTVLNHTNNDLSNLQEIAEWALDNNDLEPYALTKTFDKTIGYAFVRTSKNIKGPFYCREVVVVFYKEWPEWSDHPTIKILTAYPQV